MTIRLRCTARKDPARSVVLSSIDATAPVGSNTRRCEHKRWRKQRRGAVLRCNDDLVVASDQQHGRQSVGQGRVCQL